jgi:hypothetical protein
MIAKNIFLFVLMFSCSLFTCAQTKNSSNNKKNKESTYSSVDFDELDKMDSDGDNVFDSNDKCPGTPKDVKVDKNGCPLDNDEDGIPDYRDKELMTKRNALVDQNGVTVTDAMLKEKKNPMDSLATERSAMFNENPSLSYLKGIEDKSSGNKGESGNIIPYSLRGADRNKDGFISTDEIAKAIDAFFEGGSDFTVEKLNALIDYFFEQ